MNGLKKIYSISFFVLILFNLSSTAIAVTNINSVTLQDDTEEPNISNVSYSPDTVYADTIVTASCIVEDVGGMDEDASGIDRVICQYSTDEGVTWTDLNTDNATNEYSASIPKQKAKTGVMVRFKAWDKAGNMALSNKVTYTVNSDKYDLTSYLNELMAMAFNALRFIIVIVLLACAVAFTVWWVLYVFKVFPQMLADLTGRIRESYGQIGVFLFILLFFPSILVFIIHFLGENINLLIFALEGIVGRLIQDTSI